ncbi:MAG: hypothetical protein QXO69_02910 [archaeon]
MNISPSLIEKLKKVQEEEKRIKSDRAADRLADAEVLRRVRASANASEMVNEIERSGVFKVNNPSALKANFIDFLLKKEFMSAEQSKELLKQRLDFLKEKKIIEEL